ncbi:MAG: gamma-glutamylcyclotransferase [Synechococcaceae cyanobacterium RM1_1_27]|nr:gamma-glutamylcyclotransferase [Synechococcaceae cyanobacterium RM1_1_27]
MEASWTDVFVYGTLKPGECNFVGVASQHENRYCGSKVISSQRAYILGELYHFPALGYPGAIPGTRQVHGFVLTFGDSAILAKLDELEDYDPTRNAAENEYTRELVLTYTPSGVASIWAWVYLMSPDRICQWGGILVPDGWWTS